MAKKKVEFVFRTVYEIDEENPKELKYETEYQAVELGNQCDTVEIFIDGVSQGGEQELKKVYNRVRRRGY